MKQPSKSQNQNKTNPPTKKFDDDSFFLNVYDDDEYEKFVDNFDFDNNFDFDENAQNIEGARELVPQYKIDAKLKDRVILHSDVNNFFASVECSTRPELAGKPVAVTGNPDKRTGIILAKNDIAKAQGVKTGEAIWEAKQKCPNLITLAPHYATYERISKQLHEIYLNYTDFVEPLGMDECWLDITHSLKFLGKNGQQVADEIRQRVKKQFGFTVSVGVSFCKIFAKLGSDMKKPDATTVLSAQNFVEKTYNLPLGSIVGIGRRLTKKFEKMNILTIGEFATLPEEFVREVMGKTGVELRLKLRGDWDEPVKCYYQLEPPKSIGNGTTTIVDITQRGDIEKVVAFLAEKIALRLQNAQFEADTISVSLKTANFERFHHSRHIAAIASEEEIKQNAMSLIDSFWKYNLPVRALRVSLSGLHKIDQFQQLSFFSQQPNALEESIAAIKNKYGRNSIFVASDTASFINRKTDDEAPNQS